MADLTDWEQAERRFALFFTSSFFFICLALLVLVWGFAVFGVPPDEIGVPEWGIILFGVLMTIPIVVMMAFLAIGFIRTIQGKSL